MFKINRNCLLQPSTVMQLHQLFDLAVDQQLSIILVLRCFCRRFVCQASHSKSCII